MRLVHFLKTFKDEVPGIQEIYGVQLLLGTGYTVLPGDTYAMHGSLLVVDKPFNTWNPQTDKWPNYSWYDNNYAYRIIISDLIEAKSVELWKHTEEPANDS